MKDIYKKIILPSLVGLAAFAGVAGGSVLKAKAAAVTAGSVGSDATAAKNAVYEAQVKKSDGTVVLVKMDANFKVKALKYLRKLAMQVGI